MQTYQTMPENCYFQRTSQPIVRRTEESEPLLLVMLSTILPQRLVVQHQHTIARSTTFSYADWCRLPGCLLGSHSCNTPTCNGAHRVRIVRICSATGIQQGDPLGPILFAMAVDEAASSLSSKVNIWHLGNTTLDGPAESVFEDMHKCVTELKKICLKVNPSKCEIINTSHPVYKFTKLMTTLALDPPGLKRTELADMELLGSAILNQAALGSPLLRCVEMHSNLKSIVEVCWNVKLLEVVWWVALKCQATGSPLLRCV